MREAIAADIVAKRFVGHDYYANIMYNFRGNDELSKCNSEAKNSRGLTMIFVCRKTKKR